MRLPPWKSVLSVSSAVILALLFLVAGVWKITDPLGMATRMIQAKVPAQLAEAAAVTFGILETFAGLLLLVPRFRRWGAWLTGALLVAFMIHIGIHYEALRGAECSCFPWVKRAVGPAFFIGDAAMLALAVVAGSWSHPAHSKRSAAIILGAVSVFAFVSLGVVKARQTGIVAPDEITAGGQPLSLRHGRQFVYFFDPECSHCYQAAQKMAKYGWRAEVKLVAVPTAMPQFAQSFLRDTGFNAAVSNDLEKLRKTFEFVSGPYAVAIEDGRQKEAFRHFEGNEPEAGLRKIGFIY